MKGIRFYLEHNSKRDKRQNNHNGNVLAVIYNQNWIADRGDGQLDIMYESIGALLYHPNSVVCGTSASHGYIREKCKRISEEKARQIHPELFRYLDQ